MKKSHQINKQKHFKVLLLAAVFYMATVSVCSAQNNDFSGSWKINLQKSVFGEVPLYTVSKALKVTQLQNNLTIDRVNIATTGLDSASTERLVFKGQPSETIDGVQRPRKMTASLSEDGKTLAEYTSVTDRDGKMLFYITDTWTLIDVKLLQIERKVKVHNGFEYTVKAIYDKQ